MKHTCSVTLFRRKTLGNEVLWERHFIPKAHVTTVLSANSNISVKGFVPNSQITVRIPHSSGLKPEPGDRLYIGGTQCTTPPSSCLTVLSVSGGERGARSIRFKKVVCG